MSKIIEGILKDLKAVPENLKRKSRESRQKETADYEPSLYLCGIFLR